MANIVFERIMFVNRSSGALFRIICDTMFQGETLAAVLSLSLSFRLFEREQTRIKENKNGRRRVPSENWEDGDPEPRARRWSSLTTTKCFKRARHFKATLSLYLSLSLSRAARPAGKTSDQTGRFMAFEILSDVWTRGHFLSVFTCPAVLYSQKQQSETSFRGRFFLSFFFSFFLTDARTFCVCVRACRAIVRYCEEREA